MTQEDFFARYKYDRTKDLIGGGGFGNVYKVFDTIENETLALKIAEVKQGQESLSLLKEVELASSLKRHVNIARYTACYRFDLPNGHFDFGILQYYPLGNLSQLVKSQMLNYGEKEQIAHGIISGLQHLHNNNIVHRDLKSANILIAQGYQGEYVPKIADFGLSKQFAQNENSYFSNSFAGGSLLYVAPEQLEGKELRKNVDLWSLGVVLFELFVGETPFRANVDDGSETARAEIISKIRNASLPASIINVPSPWQEIIRLCLVTNPSNRVKSIEEVQDIVNGKINVKKDSDRTDVDTVIIPRKASEVKIVSKEIPNPKVSSKEKNVETTDSDKNTTSYIWIYALIAILIIWLVIFLFFKSNHKTPTNFIAEEDPVVQQATEKDLREYYQEILDEELLKLIYDKYGLKEKGNFETFKNDMRFHSVQKHVFEKYLKDQGTFSQFQQDLGIKSKPLKMVGGSGDQPTEPIESREKDKATPNIVDDIAASMVQIQGGTFTMGCTSEQGSDCSDYERHTHVESVKDFYIMKHEVTQELWESIMGNNPSYFKNCLRCPVESVSLNDVRGFIIKLNKVSGRKYRLPTEIEWEYAARGGHKSKGYKYSGSNKLLEVAWFTDNSSGKTHEILQKRPNELGLYDMSGNVWEWTSSNFGESTKVIRGGAWTCFSIDCRVSHRGSDVSQNWSNSYFGFRLASD